MLATTCRLTDAEAGFDTALLMGVVDIYMLVRTRFATGFVAICALFLAGCAGDAATPQQPAPRPAPHSAGGAPTPLPQTPGVTVPNDQQVVMEVNKAVVVTVELPGDLTVADALQNIERQYQPDDRQGRTFAILDAYGEKTPEGNLHISMHVSSEKPGFGKLVYKPTGQMLWSVKIAPGEAGAQPFSRKDLKITIDDGKGGARYVDGTSNPSTILGATIKDLNVSVSTYWPDGQEREVTFFYSACGCPVKVKATRTGNRIVRSSDLPVIFPDDPAAVLVINKLMGW